MDLEYYVSKKVDQLNIPLNFRQRNYLEQLFLESYSKGNELAHAVTDKAIFYSQAMPFLQEAIDPFNNDRDLLERLSLGEWTEAVNVKNLLHNLRDRFFQRNASYTPKEELLHHDLVGHENKIIQSTLGLIEEGLLTALEEWCQGKVMDLATKELEKEQAAPAPKTKVNKPLVDNSDNYTTSEKLKGYHDYRKVYENTDNPEDKYNALFNMMAIEHGWKDEHHKNLEKKFNGDIDKMLEGLEKAFEAMEFMSYL